MTSLARILVGFDGSEKDSAALRWAIELVERMGDSVSVEVFHALGLLDSANRAGEGESESAHDRAVRETTQAMRRTIDAVRPNGWLDISLTLRSGDPLLLLFAEIESTRPDLVVIGRRTAGRSDDAVLGSVSREVASRARVPVVVVPQT